jgi:chromosome transmission fidelity protein 4
LRVTFYNADTAEIFKETGLPITPFSSLVWVGFSEEGLPITKDSKGIVRALVGFNAWTPIYDDSDKNHILWLKGMIDYNLIGFYLGKDELEPRLIGKLNNEKSVPMELLLP